MKTCSNCKESKELEQFPKNKKAKDGYQSWCKKCHNDYAKTDVAKAARKKWAKNNPHVLRAACDRWRKANPARHRASIYKFAREKKEEYLAIQDRYQTKIPPGVYVVKYLDTVIYVGSARRPINRMNLHLSTIKTRNNITKVNKLHSFCGYNREDFSAEVVWNCEPEYLIECERVFEQVYNAKANYKRLLPDAMTTKQIHAIFFAK